MAASEPFVQVELFGASHLIHTLESWALRAGAAEPAYEAMHQRAMEIEKDLFESEGATGEHGGWPGYTEGSRAAKTSTSLLRQTDALFNSLTEASDPNHRFIVTRSGWGMGTNLDYAEFIQTGTKNMPQRRLFDWTIEQRQSFVEIEREWITRAGLRPVRSGITGFGVRSTRTGRFIG
jgi:hypothetical protein